MKRDLGFWWLPLARRVLGWALVGALVWGGCALVMTGVPLYSWLVWYEAQPVPASEATGRYDGLAVVLLVYVTLFVDLIASVLGALVGVVVGFCASPSDTRNPLKSRFFRVVNHQTFWFWLATSLASVSTIVVVNYYFVKVFPLGLSLVCGAAFSLVLFPLSLWRAVNRARR